MHTKCIIELQAFGPDGADGRSSREKTRLGGHLCAAAEREIDFERKTLLARKGWGVTLCTSEIASEVKARITQLENRRKS